MSTIATVYRRLEPLLPSRSFEAAMRFALLNPSLRALVNWTYNELGWRQKRYFWDLFGGAFVDHDVPTFDADWKVVFNEREIALPLTARRLWLDWLLAVSCLGQDAEVKQAYASILKSKFRPDLFVDVGANYGQNSILFLVHGIRTISFEPNPACHEYFMEVAQLNHVKPDIRNLAVGDTHESLQILYAEGQTWNGSADPDVQKQLRATSDSRLCEVRVGQTTLDDVLASQTTEITLIKIDTEGFEHRVFRGAHGVLASGKAMIIFEAWPEPSTRAPLFEVLAGAHYHVFSIPWMASSGPLSRKEFEMEVGLNFLAVPAGTALSHLISRPSPPPAKYRLSSTS